MPVDCPTNAAATGARRVPRSCRPLPSLFLMSSSITMNSMRAQRHRSPRLLMAASRGFAVEAVGDPVYWDSESNCLREGQILVPKADATLLVKLQAVVRPWEMPFVAERTRSVPRRRSMAPRPVGDSRTVPRPVLNGATRDDRTSQLFELLASELLAGRPTLCTYTAAVGVVLG